MGNTLVPGNACEAELARMIKQYGGMLVGTCTMLLGDADLAQDAVQETFIKAYHRMDSFRSEFEGSEKAWLTRIAVNVCRDHQRSRWFRFVDRRTPIDSLILCPDHIRTPEACELAEKLAGKTENGRVCYERYAGGAPFNVACGLKKLGTQCGFCGCVGDDLIGSLVHHVDRPGADVQDDVVAVQLVLMYHKD